MTAAVRSINPNGSSYIYHFSENSLEDMPPELSQALDNYNKLYQEYHKTHTFVLPSETVDQYNSVVTQIHQKFPDSKDHYPLLPCYTLTGYPATTAAMYQAIDLYYFVNTSMMPDVNTSGLDIHTSMQSILDGFYGGFHSESTPFRNKIALSSHHTAILSTVERAIPNNAKIFYRAAYYDFTLNTQSYVHANSSASKGTWKGTFTLTSLTQTDDSGKKLSLTSSLITLSISGDLALFTQQKIYRAMCEKENAALYDITNLKLEEHTFKAQLSLYSLQELQNLCDAFQGGLDVLLSCQTENINDPDEILKKYTEFYTARKTLIELEISKRQDMVDAIKNIYYMDPKTNQGAGVLYNIRQNTNAVLNFEGYLKSLPSGNQLWKTFCSYRREDRYTNPNYISDGLSNAELIHHAEKLLENAVKELYQASHPQYTLTSTMNNLLVLKEFQPLVSAFSTGNWIRVAIDGAIFRLRLLSYQVNYEELPVIDVEFSTIETVWSGISDVKSVLASASSMAQSYAGVLRQMERTKDISDRMESWIREGLQATQTKFVDSKNQELVLDSHGILARSYDDSTNTYSPCQLKLLSNGLYTTADAWDTINAGVGKISYTDPETKEQVDDYGVIAKTVAGKLFLGEKLSIYNDSGTLKFNDSGLTVSNNNNTISINPNDSEKLFKITNARKDNVFFTDDAGNLNLQGKIYSEHGEIGGWTISESGFYHGTDSISSAIPGSFLGRSGFRQYMDENHHITIENGGIKACGGKAYIIDQEAEHYPALNLCGGEIELSVQGSPYNESSYGGMKLSHRGITLYGNPDEVILEATDYGVFLRSLCVTDGNALFHHAIQVSGAASFSSDIQFPDGQTYQNLITRLETLEKTVQELMDSKNDTEGES